MSQKTVSSKPSVCCQVFLLFPNLKYVLQYCFSKIKTFFLLVLITSFSAWFSFVLFLVSLFLFQYHNFNGIINNNFSSVDVTLYTVIFHAFAIIVVIHIFMTADYQLRIRFTRRIYDVIYRNFYVKGTLTDIKKMVLRKVLFLW